MTRLAAWAEQSADEHYEYGLECGRAARAERRDRSGARTPAPLPPVYNAEHAFDICSKYFVIQEFFEYGLWPGCGNYAMDVVLAGGYDTFDFAGSCSSRAFLSYMTGMDF